MFKWKGGIQIMKKKKKLMKLAESNMKILKNGKLKVSKGQKINLEPFIDGSVKEAIVGRLDYIPTKEDVVVDTKDLHLDIDSSLVSCLKVAELNSRVTNKTHVGNSTIAMVISKKDALKTFDFLDGGTIGSILRTSTLASIYKKLKPEWSDLNEEDKSQFTNVLYIPNVMLFIDPDTGKFKKHPSTINLLILAVPNTAKMNGESVEEVSDEDAAARIIADIVEAGIKCGVKDLIVDPFGYKVLSKDDHTTAVLWNQIISSQRTIEQYNSIVFCMEDENQFVIFNASRTKNA